jgi:hypothetical protein
MSTYTSLEPGYRYQEERMTALRSFYDAIYPSGAIIHDSPAKTREEIIHSIATVAKLRLVDTDTQSAPLTVLNLGSGPQALEKEYYDYAEQASDSNLRRLLKATRFITLDIASIPADRLLVGRDSLDVSVGHVQATSAQIPLSNNSVGVVASNLSVDMLRVHPNDYDRALREIARVLTTDGVGLFTFHHPQIYTSHAESAELSPHSYEGVYFNPDAHNPFYGDAADIVTDFALAGMEIDAVRLHSEEPENWWHVNARKIDASLTD